VSRAHGRLPDSRTSESNTAAGGLALKYLRELANLSTFEDYSIEVAGAIAF